MAEFGERCQKARLGVWAAVQSAVLMEKVWSCACGVTTTINKNSLGGRCSTVSPEDEARSGGVGAGLDMWGHNGGTWGAAVISGGVPVAATAGAGAGGARFEDEGLCVLVLKLKHQIWLSPLVPL